MMGALGAAKPQGELATALARFQAAMPVVAKSKTATVRGKDGSAGYSYTYAGLAEVSAAAAPLMAEHGLSFACLPQIDDQGRLTLLGILLHSSGEQLMATLPIAGSTPQQIGSSLTYARRYLMGCMTGIVTDDDDDGAAASQPRARKAAAAAAPPAGRTQTVRRKPRAPAGQPVSDVPLPETWQAPLDPWQSGENPPPAAAAGQGSPPDPASTPHAPQVVPPEPSGPGLGDGLRRGLMSATSRVGIDPTTERDTRLALWSALLARKVTTTNGLTRAEGLTLLRRLNDVETGAVEWDLDATTGAVTLRHVDREPPT
jgi:hypothetical protein